MITQYENIVEISLSWSVCRFILTRKFSWLRMVASVDNGYPQPFRLEPRGSADDPVTHNSELNSSTILDIPPMSSCPHWLPRCVSLWFLTANLPGPRCYEVSWLENNRSSCPHVTLCPQSNNSDKFNFVLNSKDTTHTPDAYKQQFLLWQRAEVSDMSTSLVLVVVLASRKTAAANEAFSGQEQQRLLLLLHT